MYEQFASLSSAQRTRSTSKIPLPESAPTQKQHFFAIRRFHVYRTCVRVLPAELKRRLDQHSRSLARATASKVLTTACRVVLANTTSRP
jgi:hypothetical protein